MPMNASSSTRGHKTVFADEFDGNSVGAPGGSSWNHTLPGNVRSIFKYTGEKQIYVDKGFKGANIDPFSVDDGVLTITAAKTPASALSALGGLKYTSGILTTYDALQFTYGYVEIRAEIPKGQGFWPAFFLRNADTSVTSEIDIMEMIGNRTNFLFQTVHYTPDGGGPLKMDKTVRKTVSDLSNGMHTYGVDWGPNNITFFLDGQKMGSMATPNSMKNPMYLLANLAIGGHFPGDPDGSTKWPAEYKIDYIRVAQNAESFTPITKNGGGNNDVLAGADGADHLNGGAGNDTLLGGGGSDDLDGGASNDRLNGGFGNDTLDGGPGNDTLIGNKGDDTFLVNGPGNVVLEQIGGGNDTVVTTLSSYVIQSTIENLTHLGDSAFRGIGNGNANIMTGAGGNDTLISSAGADKLYGNAGNDFLSAGIGNDTLVGGGGSDTLYGDQGADLFVFNKSDAAGRDLIKDFHVGEDHLDLRSFGINSLAEGKAVASDTKAGLVFHLGTETITLAGVKEAHLTTTDFIA